MKKYLKKLIQQNYIQDFYGEKFWENKSVKF